MKTKTWIEIIFISILCVHGLLAQNQNEDIDLISAYEDYVEMDRELVYAHLNKSTYIKGETIGVKAYVVDKSSKRLATQAANLYCIITDTSGTIIEQKLLMVENGTAVGDFTIDDTYTSGNYLIKLYTNWMRNFDENNLFVEMIRIIDPVIEQELRSQITTKVDAQFMPEGGHLLSDAENVIGVVIKNDKGLGIPEIEGDILNQDGEIVTNFKVNQFGIGRCLLTPKSGNTYTARFTYDEQEHITTLKDIEPQGLTMSLNALKGKIALTFKTNSQTLPDISQSVFKLAIHNGQDFKEIAFKFGAQTEVVKVISNEDLFSGINIFTVFDAKNNPLLERLYFNYENLKIQSSGEQISTVTNDTISISLPYKIEDNATLNSFSVSVLPKNTNAFHHQNIISQFTLQPYLKGFVEQAQYYFSNITRKKQFELDNLLITQGWSSYDWNTIFNDPPEYDYDYENGISYTINSADKNDKQLMIFPTLNHPMKIVALTKEQNAFMASGLFPVDNEEVKVREISTNGKIIKPNLYVQFDPLKIPSVQHTIDPLISNALEMKSIDVDLSMKTNLKQIQSLDEVVINKKKTYTEIEKLNDRSLGTVEEMDAEMVKRYRTLERYLRDKGFFVQNGTNNSSGEFVILNNIGNSFRDRFVEDESVAGPGFAPVTAQEASSIPIVYLDDILLHQNLNLLQNMSLEDIEWIEVNKAGVGGGMRSGGAGLIRIKTRSTFRVDSSNDNVYSSYEIPLKFSVAKKFYVPEYVSYDNAFFNTFGVIDWFPNLTLDDQGQLNFNISNHQFKEFKVVVEGMINDTFVSEVKTIILN